MFAHLDLSCSPETLSLYNLRRYFNRQELYQRCDLFRVSPAKEQIADRADEGCGTYAYSSHFVASNVTPVLGRGAKRDYKND